jgi:hypothetical protein
MARTIDYWTLVEPVWLRLNRSWDDGPEAFIRRFRSIQLEIGHLYAAHWCQSEVCNGGLEQFFFNSTGLLAPEALEGFRAISTTELAKALGAAMNQFGSPYPRDRAARQKYLSKLKRGARRKHDPFEDWDDQFYKWEQNWEKAADAYATRFIAKVKRSRKRES